MQQPQSWAFLFKKNPYYVCQLITFTSWFVYAMVSLVVNSYKLSKSMCVDSGLYANVILQLIVTCVWFIKTTLSTIFNIYHAPVNCMIHSSGCIVFIWTSSELFYSCATQHLTSLDIYHASFAWFILVVCIFVKLLAFLHGRNMPCLNAKKIKSSI